MYKGSLIKWNDPKGYGFISCDCPKREVFAHISDFPKDGNRPTVGEFVAFDIVAENGKEKAIKIIYLDRVTVVPTPKKREKTIQDAIVPILSKTILTLVILTSGFFLFFFIKNNPTISTLKPESTDSAAQYRCDGRIHCSQMTSCAEAKFFLNNCPGVKMDGDRDGIPCEDQLCRR